MHKKSFAFGMGTGILLIALIFFFIYGYQRNALLGMGVSQQNEMTEQDIIAEAKKLGMAFYISGEQTPPAQTEITNAEIISKALDLGMTFTQPKTQDMQPINNVEPEQDVDEVSDDEQAFNIFIPWGTTSADICSILFENGVIADQNDFSNYLKEMNSTKILGYGDKKIPYGSGYEEILYILTH